MKAVERETMDIAKFAGEAVHAWPIPFLALEVVQDPSGHLDDLRVLWANRLAHERYGDDLVGRWLDRDAALGTNEPVASAALAGGSPTIRSFERTAHRDGRTLHLRCTLVPTDGGCIAMMVEDVTAEATTRTDLALAGNTLAHVERWGNLGVWEVDLASRSVYWSTQVFEILGLDEPGLEHFRGAVHPDDLAMVDHLLKRVVDQPGPYHINHRILRGGETRTLDQHVQSVPDAHGHPTRLIGTMFDVTATHAMAQQVHQAQKMRTLGLLAGGLAHDFNNVLMVVRGHADLLLSRMAQDDPSRPSLEAIAGAGARASDLTRKLMALGRQEDLHPRTIHVLPLLTELADLVGPAVEGDGLVVEVDTESSGEPAEVFADADQLGQVVIDLVLNARDAGARRIQLRFETTHVESQDPVVGGVPLAPGTYGAIEVTDDGEGMDETTLERIFEPFFTTKDASSGSGLGLANAQSFAQRSSGGLLARSEPGTGTTMSLLLPAPLPAEAPSPPKRRGRSHTRLLVVAHDDAHCERLAGNLRQLGHQLVCVEDLDAMTFSLATEPIDLVVVDGELLSGNTPSPSTGPVPSVVVDGAGTGDRVAYDDVTGLRAVVEDLLGS